METVSGRVTLVEENLLGDNLAVAASIGDTSLTLEDPGPLSEDGGLALLRDPEGDQADLVVTYTSVDPDTGIMVLSAALADAWGTDTLVLPHPFHKERYAHIRPDDDDTQEDLACRITGDKWGLLAPGTRDEGMGEQVTIAHDGTEWVVTDVVGKEAAGKASVIITHDDQVGTRVLPDTDLSEWDRLALYDSPSIILDVTTYDNGAGYKELYIYPQVDEAWLASRVTPFVGASVRFETNKDISSTGAPIRNIKWDTLNHQSHAFYDDAGDDRRKTKLLVPAGAPSGLYKARVYLSFQGLDSHFTNDYLKHWLLVRFNGDPSISETCDVTRLNGDGSSFSNAATLTMVCEYTMWCEPGDYFDVELTMERTSAGTTTIIGGRKFNRFEIEYLGGGTLEADFPASTTAADYTIL